MIREKNSDVEKKRDIAVRKMIEKEKLREKIELIKKAPEAEVAKQYLVEMGILNVHYEKN